MEIYQWSGGLEREEFHSLRAQDGGDFEDPEFRMWGFRGPEAQNVKNPCNSGDFWDRLDFYQLGLEIYQSGLEIYQSGLEIYRYAVGNTPHPSFNPD